MKIAVPPGIGDSLWALTKVQAILREAGQSQANLVIADNAPQRSKEFLESFDFIHSAEYRPLPFMARPRTTPDHRWNYVPTGRNFGCDWWLCPNEHLEQGKRLETWLPQYETNWNVQEHYLWHEADLEFATQLKQRLGRYCVFYLGPETGNTRAGHNRGGLWSIADWVRLGTLLAVPIVVVGAPYDRSYSDKVLTAAHEAGSHWLDYVGQWKIGRTFAVVRKAEFVISYQSGIGIFASYLRVPTCIWWRAAGDSLESGFKLWFHEEMRNAWAPPDMLASGRHNGLIYGRADAGPEAIAAWSNHLRA